MSSVICRSSARIWDTVADTYYYMEATGPLMKQIAERSETFLQGVQPS
jgi:hypothetical protein